MLRASQSSVIMRACCEALLYPFIKLVLNRKSMFCSLGCTNAHILSNMRTSASLWLLFHPSIRDFEEDDTGEDEGDTEEAEERGGVVKEGNADEEGGSGADAGPDGVGGADGDVFLGNEEEEAAKRHGDDGEENPEDAGGGMKRSELHPDRPADLTDSG